MRRPAPRFVLLFLLAMFATAHADTRSDARTHYQAGQKAYAAGDYRVAIKEFSAAQQLAPADLNNYNLALCYDKLGEAEPAVQYYKEYLAKVPNAPKRSEIEASVARLEAALSSASSKRAEEARKEEARKAEEARIAEEARKAEEARRAPPPVPPVTDPYANPTTNPNTPPAVGSTGVPATGQAVSTGDAQLDRVSTIDVSSIRDQRVGAGGSGVPDNRGGPATNAQNPNAQNPNAPPVAGATNASAPQNAQNPQGTLPPSDQPVKKEQPVYKKWWFWAVVAVSAYVVYSIATEGSNSSSARTLPPPASNESGMTLLRF